MKSTFRSKFDFFSEWVADQLGRPVAFGLALAAIAMWALWGPFTGFSQTWQLVINSGTTIATFLMVFLLQNTQNRDTHEVHDVLRELSQRQAQIISLQRQLSERIHVIELSLDDQPR